MKQRIFFLLLVAGALLGCKPESEHYTIPRLDDELHIRASVSSLRLLQSQSKDTAITFSWDIPELKDGITGFEYYFKMDIADNSFATSITPMLMDGGNTVSFTHGTINDLLEGWGIAAGSWTALEAEIIAHPKGLDTYVKPMLSTVTFDVMGYASVLYMVGSATSVGDDYTVAIEMSKVPARNAYTWTGALTEGELLFLTSRSDSTDRALPHKRSSTRTPKKPDRSPSPMLDTMLSKPTSKDSLSQRRNRSSSLVRLPMAGYSAMPSL